MKNKVILFSLVSASVLCAQTIKSIDYVNLNKISPKIVNETLDLKAGDELNYEKLNNAIKTFYNYGYFTDILVENEDGNIKFIFKENPSIAKVDIKGYKTRAEDIDQLRTLIKLKKGSMYTEKRVEEAKKTLLSMLESEGYINSVVETEIEELNEHSVSLLFNVNKGDEIIIKKANYYGSNELDDDDFDHVTANKEKEFASWWFGQNDGEVKIDQLKYDARRINELYYEKGFLDAKVKEPFLDIDFASNQAKLDFFIEEGTKYTTNDIKIYVDETIVKAEDLYPELKSIVGNTFNIKKLRLDQNFIKTQVANQGYAYADIRFDLKKDKENSKVDIIFNVIPGKKVYINDVKISGNTRTLDRVIRRDVYLAPGDLYNLTDFKDSRNKLKRTGFFDDVKIEEKRVSEDKIDIVVNVTEAATGSLMLGGGYGSYDKLMVNAAISDKNVFGSGIGASLGTELSAHQSDFSLKLTNPAIFDSKYNASIDIHSSESEIDRDNYEATKTVKGFTVGVGREVIRNLYAGAKYRLDFIKEDYTWDDNFTKDPTKKYLEDAEYTTSSITPYINFDNTDDFYLPREGYKIGTSLEYAGVGGDSKYLKSNSYFKYFYSLEDMAELDWIFRFKTQLKILVDNGQINQGDSLYLGGPRSLRGYKSYAFGPNNDDGIVEEPYKNLSSTSLEMSFPLIPTANMRWGVFYDYGMIGIDSFSEVQRSSTGALLEWISPFGPLQLIFAQALDDEPGDETSSFEFSLGAAFLMVKKIENKIDRDIINRRITNEEALDLIKNASLLELGELASLKKEQLHPEKITSFIVDRNINYTNVCWVDCKFCAFYRHGRDDDSYVLKFDEIDQKIDELLEIGGTQILFQGGVHPKLKIDYYEELVSHIHTKYPQITIHGFSAIEIKYIAKVSKISILEVLKRLQAKGLSSIPGAGAEILSDRVRDIIAPNKMDSLEWIEVHELAHSIGMKTTATMMFGTVETDEEIIEHWELLRKLQDKSGGFRAFIMWSFQGQNTKLMEEHPEIKPQSSNRYLRLLAVSRLYLDNFKNMQSSWVTQGSYVGQLALKFGANDLGSTMMEENVVKAAGAANRMNQDEMIRLIKDVGEYPAKRNTAYEILEKF